MGIPQFFMHPKKIPYGMRFLKALCAYLWVLGRSGFTSHIQVIPPVFLTIGHIIYTKTLAITTITTEFFV